MRFGQVRSASTAICVALSLTVGPHAWPAPPEHPDSIHRIVVKVVVESLDTGPEDGRPVGKGKGAGRGAGRALGGMWTAVDELDSGFIAFLALLATPIVAAGGALAGAAGSSSKRAVENRQALIDGIPTSSELQETFIRHLETHTPAKVILEPAATESPVGEALVVEVAYFAQASGRGPNPAVQIHIKARARLAAGPDGSGTGLRRIRHGSAVHDLEDWIADDCRLLQEELDRAYDLLADRIVAELFEVHRIPPRSVELPAVEQTTVVATNKKRRSRDETGHPGGQPTYLGLRPASPRTPGPNRVSDVRGRLSYKQWTRIETLRPVFRWESFPPAGDALASQGSVTDVTYELRLARGNRYGPLEVVYQRKELTTPELELEETLQKHTRYFWTVRAHFKLDNAPKYTEWGSIHTASQTLIDAPNAYSYRFVTPRREN